MQTSSLFTDYITFKKAVESQDIKRNKIDLAKLTIIDRNFVSYGNVRFEITPKAFTELARILGITQEIINKMEGIVNEEFATNILKLMKSGIVKHGKGNVAIYFDAKSKKIVNFKKSIDSTLSNNGMLSLFEQVMDSNKGMEIKTMSLSESGDLEITTLNHNWEFQPNNLNDEKFKAGVAFFNSPEKTFLAPFNERLVCLNGMITTSRDIILQLGGTNNAKTTQAFFEAARQLDFDTHFSGVFKTQVNKAINTVASYNEVQSMYNKVLYELRADIREDINTRHLLEAHIPIMEIKAAYLKAGVDLHGDNVSAKDWSSARTNMTIWELVNAITYIATHYTDNGLMFRDGEEAKIRLQRIAGMFLYKQNFDLGINFPSVF
jgi:vacuolar-type H+-ATPase subunit E/Vma4